MLNRNARYYEWLLPYLEGGLGETQRAQIEARLREDPTLAAEAARLRRTLDGLRTAARQPRAENSQVPKDLWPRLRARLEMEESAKPSPAPARSTNAWWLTGVGATAAATLALAMVWLPGWHAPEQINSHPTPKVSSPIGPGRTAGPPPVIPPHMTASPPTKVVSNPTATIKPGKTPAPSPLAALPPPTYSVTAPMYSVTDGNRSDPFALHPMPPTVLNGTQPALPLPAKSAIPSAARSLGVTASRRMTRDGQDEVAPGAPVAVGGANNLTPSQSPQDKPVTAPLMAMAPPAPVMARIQNGPQPLATGPAASARQGQAVPQAKSQGRIFASIPLTTFRAANSPEHGTRQDKATSKVAAPASVMNNTLQTQAMGGGGFPGGGGGFGGNVPEGLDTWQATLAAAMQPPLWGDTTGEQQANQALMAAKESGALDDLRARLEARRSQSPKDLVTGRMLAAVYDYGFSRESALHERRRVANLDGAVGEDWYTLAQAEERAGNTQAARAAYRRALECPVPPSPFHASLARLRS